MIVVTGATGQLGRLVVDHLLRRGVPAGEVVAAVRAPERAAGLAARGVVVREADYDRPDTLAPAFAGADKLLFVSSSGPDDLRVPQHRAVVEAAQAAGAGLVAYTSIVNAGANPLSLARVHRATEKFLAASGLPTVLVRNNWYTENRTAGLAAAVEHGAIAGSAGAGRIASASRADFAEAAAVVLTSDVAAGAVYELTGDTAWSLPEFAAEVSAASGREVAYTDLPPERYADLLAGAGVPGFMVEALVDADVRTAEGALAHVTTDLSDLLGRPTTPLAETVAEALKG
ncbi:SDR family oxidoreductase [Streptomonospora sp. S1-112]|uniref:SDR family oxidoreductase n=1 Tax=Streptomonospora mangrovi TaxID=2883123 RepID=A0A9X3NNX4_9ACTN|nr:SDR family oxidoreductase [Streptomonospora mangrovi]MDA0566837.1 SDR family oxidoreductase [Streptomonospora mangrovi]